MAKETKNERKMADHLVLPAGYPYAYETHMHTSQASRCGVNTGAEEARAYKAAGYTGIIVTDHFYHGNTAIDRRLPWSDWVEAYCGGYEDAKKEGDQIGLDVFFGWEAGYNGTEFLIYGLDKAWLLSHPEIAEATIEEQLQLVHAGGGIVIHAHPFRREPYIPAVCLFPELVDGVETINATHFHKDAPHQEVFNTLALHYAQEHLLPMTGGSDMHSNRLWFGGMAFSRRLRDIHDFTDAVMKREGKVLLSEYCKGNEAAQG